MPARILLACALCLALVSAPAAAADTAQIPEGSSLTLFALGLAGLIAGRRLAAGARRRDDEDR